MQRLGLLLLLILIYACNRSGIISGAANPDLLANQFLTLREAVSFENKINSRDISYAHFVEIGEGLYPNVHNYELTTLRTFLRRNEGLEYSINYYTTLDDSIRVVLFEWTTNQTIQEGDTTVVLMYNEEVAIQMDKMFMDLEKRITKRLGNPTYKNIIPFVNTDTERDDIKWQSPNNLNIYLLMFKNGSGYREIRMIVYRK